MSVISGHNTATTKHCTRGAGISIIGGGGGGVWPIFIYSCSAQLISFEIDSVFLQSVNTNI